jgi:hypothetical protein
MNLLKVFLLCFALFAFAGFAFTYFPLGDSNKNPYGWAYAFGVVPFVEEHTPGNVLVKIIGIATGYQFGVWAAELLQHKGFTWANFPTPTPTPRPFRDFGDILNKQLQPLTTPTP